eukprot:2267525-Pyramimonas_sp.AAC.1
MTSALTALQGSIVTIQATLSQLTIQSQPAVHAAPPSSSPTPGNAVPSGGVASGPVAAGSAAAQRPTSHIGKGGVIKTQGK